MQIVAGSVRYDSQQPRRLMWPHFLMALYGIGWAVALDYGVRIYASEVFSLVGLGFVGWRRPLDQYPMVKKILAAYGLWIIAIILADLINETAFFDSARAIATPVLGGISLVFVLAVVSRNKRSFLTFLAATALAKGVLGEPIYGDKYADIGLDINTAIQTTDYFKIRFEPFITPAIVLISCLLVRMRMHGLSYLILIMTSIMYLSMDTRSVGGILLFSSMVLIAKSYDIRLNSVTILTAITIAIAVSYGIYVAYTYNTLSSGIGHNATQLMRMKNPYNPFELMLQGRSEWSVASDVVRERPLFGYGSWARDLGNHYTDLMYDRSGVYQQRVKYENDWNYIPVHSLILSSWIWAGGLGLISSLYVVKHVLKLFQLTLSVRSPLIPAAIFFMLGSLWHCFFSPPQAVRFFFPHALAITIVLTAPVFAALPTRHRTRRMGSRVRGVSRASL